jgi:hypothetical protein
VGREGESGRPTERTVRRREEGSKGEGTERHEMGCLVKGGGESEDEKKEDGWMDG